MNQARRPTAVRSLSSVLSTEQKPAKTRIPPASARPRSATRHSLARLPIHRTRELFYVRPTMLAETSLQGDLHRGPPYVGSTLFDFRPPAETHMGNLHRLGRQNRISVSVKENRLVWSGALATAGGVVFLSERSNATSMRSMPSRQGTLQVNTRPSIIGNVTTYENGGRHRSRAVPRGGWRALSWQLSDQTRPTASRGRRLQR